MQSCRILRMAEKETRVVIVANGGIGKTCLAIQFEQKVDVVNTGVQCAEFESLYPALASYLKSNFETQCSLDKEQEKKIKKLEEDLLQQRAMLRKQIQTKHNKNYCK